MNPLVPDPASIPELPSPPISELLLFENPWLLAVILAVVGLAAAWVLLRANRARIGMGVGTVFVLAAAVAAYVSNTVETAREQMDARSRSLIAACVAGDSEAMRSILAENAVLNGGFAVVPNVQGRERIISLVDADVRGLARIDVSKVLEVRAHRDGPNLGRTHVRVRVEQSGGFINFSWWRLDWRDPGDGTWRAVAIEPLWIQGLAQ